MKKSVSKELLEQELEVLYKIDELRDDPVKDIQKFLTASIRYLGDIIDFESGEIYYKSLQNESYLPGGAVNPVSDIQKQFAVYRDQSILSCEMIRSEDGYCSIPLVLEDVAYGIISCYKKKLSDDDIYLLNAAVSQLDSGIKALHDYHKMLHNEKIRKLLLDIDGLRDEHPEDVDQFLKIAILSIVDLLDLSGCVVYMLDQIDNVYYPVYELNKSEDDFKPLINQVKKSRTVLNQNDKLYIAPLILHDVLLSIIGIEKESGLCEWDYEVFESACAQIDSGIEGILTLQKLQQKVKVIDTLYHIDELRDKFSENYEQMIIKIGERFAGILDAEIGFIVLYEKDEPVVKIVTGTEKDLNDILIDLTERTIKAEKITTMKKPFPGIISSLTIPLILHDRVIGVFGVLNPLKHKYFNIYDTELLEAIGSQADTAIFEAKEKLKIRQVFKRYVPEEVIDEMMDREDDFLTGKRKFMSVLFADMRGFTSLSEKLHEPEKVVETINEYLEAMTNVIFEYKATLDKFVGDEVMALFGTPLEMPDHALVSVRTAVAMQKAMNKILVSWKDQERGTCSIGIGINTGIMIAGNIGCEKMTDYTVLGPAVNKAARFCGKAKGRQILISEETKSSIDKFCSENSVEFEFSFNKLDAITLKGIKDPVPVYEVVYKS